MSQEPLAIDGVDDHDLARAEPPALLDHSSFAPQVLVGHEGKRTDLVLQLGDVLVVVEDDRADTVIEEGEVHPSGRGGSDPSATADRIDARERRSGDVPGTRVGVEDDVGHIGHDLRHGGSQHVAHHSEPVRFVHVVTVGGSALVGRKDREHGREEVTELPATPRVDQAAHVLHRIP